MSCLMQVSFAWFTGLLPVRIDIILINQALTLAAGISTRRKHPKRDRHLQCTMLLNMNLCCIVQRCTTVKQIEMRLNDVFVCGNVARKERLHKCGFLNCCCGILTCFSRYSYAVLTFRAKIYCIEMKAFDTSYPRFLTGSFISTFAYERKVFLCHVYLCDPSLDRDT
jgi:hypothetical protein